jgi:hypothetical protein
VITETERTLAWCSWHLDFADDVALVQPATGPDGSALYACRRCRETYRLMPYDFRPDRDGELPHHEEEETPMGDDNKHPGDPAPIEPWQPPSDPPSPDSDSSGTGSGSHGGGGDGNGDGGQ